MPTARCYVAHQVNALCPGYELFSGIQRSCCFFSLKIPEISISFPGNPASFKMCATKKDTSSIISSYCRKGSVPVGVSTLNTRKAFIEGLQCLCIFSLRSLLKPFFPTDKTYWLETNKSSLDVLFIYFIWWI